MDDKDRNYNEGITTSIVGDLDHLGHRTWERIQLHFVDWANATRTHDVDAAARAERQFRSAALAFSALQVDGGAVTTGRKAIVRSIYMQLGDDSCINVVAMLDVVIRREEAIERRGA